MVHLERKHIQIENDIQSTFKHFARGLVLSNNQHTTLSQPSIKYPKFKLCCLLKIPSSTDILVVCRVRLLSNSLFFLIPLRAALLQLDNGPKTDAFP